MTYLRDRLTVARDLLHESGSVFVQIGDENVHRVRALMDEVFGDENFCGEIAFTKTTGLTSRLIASIYDYLIWYGKSHDSTKYRSLYELRDLTKDIAGEFRLFRDHSGSIMKINDELKTKIVETNGTNIFRTNSAISPGVRANTTGRFEFQGKIFDSGGNRNWKTRMEGMLRLAKADRLILDASPSRMYQQFWSDFNHVPITNIWADVRSEQDRLYVVQTVEKVIQRCILMTTDPGDLILDPTCGSGTATFVAEQWGRRWITIDTSRVALALARARIMGARYPYYLLADTEDGRRKEAGITGKVPAAGPTHGDIRQGFVYERVPHVTLKSIANNAEIDVIWERWQATLEPLRAELNAALGEDWEEWQIPREAGEGWPGQARELHARWWEARIARQREIDGSIARNADTEFLYDRPYEDRSRVRVAGPFTVESLSPHRVIPSDEYEAMDDVAAAEGADGGRAGAGKDRSRLPYDGAAETDFAQVVLDHLRTAGVQQAHKEDRIGFTSLAPWPGRYVGAEGRFMEGERERRAAIFIGPEFGTVAKPDLIAAAREAVEAGFDVLIACGFAFDAHAAEFSKLGPLPVLRARMNPDLHMADELKNTGAGNLFVVFGEPDIEVEETADGDLQVRIRGVDVFDPQKGEVRSGGTEDIACWFIDTDYDEENFFVRHAYFLGAHDPYKALKTTLRAEIDEEAWATLYRDVSRPFPKPSTGRFAVKVINHVGDEVMKVFRV